MNTNLDNCTDLLEKSKLLIKEDEGLNAKTGRNFNIFSILKLSTKELIHSAFIAELLNPRGSHGRKDQFLKLFLDQCQLDRTRLMPTEGWDVKTEASIGFIDVSGESGGRIDVLLQSGNNKDFIIIENKIYAQDQENQLIRYRNRYPNASILYLSLFDSEPHTVSIGDVLIKDRDYKVLSYENDILEWLKRCAEETSDCPPINQIILQYIQTVKILTRQAMSDQLKSDLIDLTIKNPESIDAAKMIFECWPEIKRTILDQLLQDVTDKNGISKELGMNVDYTKNIPLGDTESGFWYFMPLWKYCIYFYFEKDEELFVGIDVLQKDYPIPLGYKEKLVSIFNNLNIGEVTNEAGWIVAARLDEWETISWSKVMKDMPELVKKIVYKISDEMKEIDLAI